MKRLILGTRLGRLALTVRDAVNLTEALFRPEVAGTLGNDRLARILVTRLCEPGQVFVDVGAHIGSVVAEVKHHNPSARVVAVEAVPAKGDDLRRRFGDIEVHGVALGEEEGEVPFFVNRRRPGYSSLGTPGADERGHVEEIRVPLRRLDRIVTSPDVDVIKIDVEGAELGVLRGGEALIAKCRPVIMFESGAPEDHGMGYPKEALFDWFAERDYALLIPNRLAHDDPGLARESFLDSHLYPRRTTNYFAVPTERRTEVRDKARRILHIR